MNNTQLPINLSNNNHKMIEEWRGGYVMNEGNKENFKIKVKFRYADFYTFWNFG